MLIMSFVEDDSLNGDDGSGTNEWQAKTIPFQQSKTFHLSSIVSTLK